MLPVLLKLPNFQIYTFGVFLTLAFLWGAFWFWRNIKLTSYKEQDMFDALFASLFGALFFSRLIFVVLNFSEFGASPLKFVLINGFPGMSAVGAFVGGFITLFFYVRYKNKSFLELVDYAIPPLFLALVIGKIGSFLAGVDVGIQTSFVLSTKVLGHEGARHITALYEAMGFVLGFVLAHKMLFAVRRERMPRGSTFYFFMVYVSLVTLLLDNLKENHLYFADFSFNLLTAVVFGLAGSLYFIIIYRSLLRQKLSRLFSKRYGRKNKLGKSEKIQSKPKGG
ncbi:MAG: prolipoprotein diacylglyceryl transferase [Candidatus Paceibacterota bacterium]